MSNFNSKYLSFSIPTIITYTIYKNPNIINIIETITNLDGDILQQKINRFFETELKIDEIIFVVLLCSLMYENDIMPTYINLILKNIGYELSIEDLKLNSNNIINSLINNDEPMIGGEKSQTFKNIMESLKHIGAVFLVAILVYYQYILYINNIQPTVLENLDTIKTIYDKMNIMINRDAVCSNLIIPSDIAFISKWGIKDFDKLYQLSECLVMSTENNVFMDEFIYDINKNTDIQQQFALVPFDHSLGNEILNKNSQELVVFNQATQIGSQIVNKLSDFQIDSIDTLNNVMSQIKVYTEMNEDQFSRLFIGDKISEEFKIKVKQDTLPSNTFLNNLMKGYEFISDVGKLVGNIMVESKIQGTNVNAINPVNSYIWTLQKYLKNEYRRLEDLKIKAQRNFEDLKTEINHTYQNGLSLINLLPWLIWYNSIIAGILLYYISLLYSKLLKPMLTIKDNMLELEDDMLKLKISDKYSGGKKNKTRKIHKRNKTKRNKKYNKKKSTKKNRTKKYMYKK